MRVLAMCHGYPPDHNAGGEMTLHSLLRRLVERGHAVDVLLSRPSDTTVNYTLDGVKVYPHRYSSDPFRWFGTQDNHPDVVIAHLENTMRAAALGAQYKVPMVHLIHNSHEFTKGALRRGPSQLAVFNTEWIKEDYAQWWEFFGSGPFPPYVVVHPPVFGQDYAAINGPHDRITLINLNEDKGGELFWDLAARLPKRKFLAVRGAYGEQIVPDVVPANVEVVEHLPPGQMATKVYARTGVLLMPSGYESYGRTAIEAAHSGIPTIAHPTPGLLEALGPAGTFARRDDPAAWVTAIDRIWRDPGASDAALALAARRNPDPDLDRFADEMEQVVRRGLAAVAR